MQTGPASYIRRTESKAPLPVPGQQASTEMLHYYFHGNLSEKSSSPGVGGILHTEFSAGNFQAGSGDIRCFLGG